jgi:glyceraldehyde-3-phosphate dehydrogenase (NADP+)
MCLAPYNYPINESYAALIPALLMGNVMILKIPTIGGLAHLLTMEAFRTTLPPGTIILLRDPDVLLCHPSCQLVLLMD